MTPIVLSKSQPRRTVLLGGLSLTSLTSGAGAIAAATSGHHVLDREWLAPATTALELMRSRLDERVRQAGLAIAALALDGRLDLNDVGACNARMLELRDRLGLINVSLADAQGVLRCSALAGPAELNVTEREWFRESIAQPSVVIEVPTVDILSKRPTISLSVRIVGADNAPLGVLAAALDIGRIVAEAWRDIARPSIALKIWSEDGLLLGRCPDPEVLLGQRLPGSDFFRAISASRRAYGSFHATSLSGIGWDYVFRAVLVGPHRIFLAASRPEPQIVYDTRLLFSRALGALSVVCASAVAFVGWARSRSERQGDDGAASGPVAPAS